MKYTIKDLEDYYNGNDVNFNIDDAENDPKFIYELLKYIIDIQKDLDEAKNYYKNYFLDTIKGNYKIVKLLLENLSSDIEFIYLVGSKYFDTEPNNDVENFEISIILSNLLKNHPDQLLRIEMAGIAQGLYLYEKRIIEKAKEKDLHTNYGHGFFLVKKEYQANPTILLYIAQNMVKEILYPNDDSKALEHLFHQHYKTSSEINNPNDFLLENIKKHDSRLANYIMPQIPNGFFSFLSKHIDQIKNNWQNYVNDINKQKKFCIEDYCYQYSESNKSIFEIDNKFYDTYDIFEQIIKEKDLNRIFDIKLEPADILYNEIKKVHNQDLTLEKFITLANTKGIDPAPVIKQYKLRDLQNYSSVPENIKLFQKNLKKLIEEAFKKDIFDPKLFIFMEFNKYKNSQVVGIFDADLMYDETPPKRN